MNREAVRSRIQAIGTVPAIRVISAEGALLAAQAVTDGDIPIVEIAMTVPAAVAVIATLAKMNPHLTVGAGSASVANRMLLLACPANLQKQNRPDLKGQEETKKGVVSESFE